MRYITFEAALVHLKRGKKIFRIGWNGKGMFLYFVPEGKYEPATKIAKDYFNGRLVPYGAYIAMKTAQNNVVPWIASQTDILANDWVYEEQPTNEEKQPTSERGDGGNVQEERV